MSDLTRSITDEELYGPRQVFTVSAYLHTGKICSDAFFSLEQAKEFTLALVENGFDAPISVSVAVFTPTMVN